MAKFCPEWVFSACVAKAAGGFLTGNAPLSSISNNIISELNQHYNEIKAESIEEAALEKSTGQVSQASDMLKLRRTTLIEKMKKLAIEKPSN